MKGTGKNHRTRAAVLFAAVLGMAWLGAAGCGAHYSQADRDFELSVLVVDHDRLPVESVEVTVWLVDEGAGGTREIVELEPTMTGADGVAVFVYRTFLQPYICGYRIESAAGDVLVDEPPVQHRYLSGSSGELTLSI
jgi:hypothetical protein